MKKYFNFIISFLILILITFNLTAQDKEAKIKLSFDKGDSLYVCSAYVTSQDSPVTEVNIKLFVKRTFGLLPIAEAETDENGIVNFEMPKDIPGDKNGNLEIIAQIEDDENYANTSSVSKVSWGVIKNTNTISGNERSLSASRDRAPVYFIVIANFIIVGIWATIIYVVMQIFAIRKISRHLHKQTNSK